MRLALRRRVNKAARLIRSRIVSSALILGYHRIASVSYDPYDMCVSPQHFAEQLEVLRQIGRPISLRELIQGLRDNELLEKAIVLTIDDGYADALYNAKPALEKVDLPATLFVATGYEGRQFWWDRLEYLLLNSAKLPERLSLPINDNIFEWPSSDNGQAGSMEANMERRRQLLMLIYKRLLPLPAPQQQEALIHLQNWVGAEIGEQSDPRSMTADELVDVANCDLLEIGAHTVTHPLLAKMSIERQQAEVEQSKVHLTELLGQPVSSFSYPNGSLSDKTIAIVKNAGFDCACTSIGDVTWRRSNLFSLPRFWIQDWNGEEFTRWLHRWL